MQIENFGTPVARKKVNVDIRAPQGVVDTSSVSIHAPSDTSLFNNTPVPLQGTEIVTCEPTADPANNYDVTWDTFFEGLPTPARASTIRTGGPDDVRILSRSAEAVVLPRSKQ